jgi:uncharacterized protein with PIN domain
VKSTFIADAMLGRLAKLLRMVGYDVLYRAGIDDSELKHVAMSEGRVLLTRDNEVAGTRLPIRIVLVASDHPEEQLRQVVTEMELEVGSDLFTRCLLCNAPVEPVPREDVREEVPPYVFETQKRFARCPSCRKIYWAATHVNRAREWLDSVLGANEGEESR